MMQFQRERTDVVMQLSRLAQSDVLSGKSRQRCQEISERLDTPVVIGFFGPSGSGKRTLLNEFLGEQVVPVNGPSVTIEVLAGPKATCTVRQDGDTVAEVQGYPTGSFLDQDSAFATITAPPCDSLHCAVLLFECGDDAHATQEALAWAADRVDMVIWCSQSWSEAEQISWSTAPDRLRDHAILALSNKSAAIPGHEQEAGFASVLDRRTDGGVASHIREMLVEAMEQELANAELFLRRYGSDEIAVAPVAPVEVDTKSEAALPHLGKLFLQLRQSAQGMLMQLDSGPIDIQDTLLAVEEALERSADLVIAHPEIGTAWPALERTIFEAGDLAVLLRYEGREEQVSQGVRLVAQLRTEIERTYLKAHPVDRLSQGRPQ
ncbi:MAG: hypothetical protein MK180_11935 [Rhodobacteraceae bacterium]|nr:hypothetical protein [Paracoccaceae bacterium]